jgi:hypothetical protein
MLGGPNDDRIQFAILGAGHLRDAVLEVLRLDDVMHLAAHLFFKLDDVVRIVVIPEGERHAAVVRA